MIRMRCGVRLVNRVFTDVLQDRVGVVIKDMIIQTRLWWYGRVIPQDINLQILEVMELEIIGKRKKGRPRKLLQQYIKKDLEQYGLRKGDAYKHKKLNQKLATPTCKNNGIKMNVVVAY